MSGLTGSSSEVTAVFFLRCFWTLVSISPASPEDETMALFMTFNKLDS